MKTHWSIYDIQTNREIKEQVKVKTFTESEFLTNASTCAKQNTHSSNIFCFWWHPVDKDDRGENNYDDAEAILVLPVIESCATFALTDQTPPVTDEEDRNCSGLWAFLGLGAIHKRLSHLRQHLLSPLTFLEIESWITKCRSDHIYHPIRQAKEFP